MYMLFCRWRLLITLTLIFTYPALLVEMCSDIYRGSMLFIAVFLCVCILGYLAQTTGLCMVRGVREFRSGNREYLLAVLFSGTLAWVAGVFSYATDFPLQYTTYTLSMWFVFGGFIFGIGSSLNGACGVFTLGKLIRGDFRMVFTVVGWLIGWSILAYWSPDKALVKMDSLPGDINILLLFLESLVIISWVIFGDIKRKKLWFGMMGIGLLAGFVYLYQPKWPPSALLHQLSQALTNNNVDALPSIEQYILFVALLLGLFVAAWHKNKFQRVRPTIKSVFVHIFAGTLMGVGASLALGANSVHLLVGLPTFSPAGFGAVVGVLVGIWSGFYIKKYINF